MPAEIFTGTLIGPHGELVGRWVRHIDYYNETMRALSEASKLRQAVMDLTSNMVYVGENAQGKVNRALDLIAGYSEKLTS